MTGRIFHVNPTPLDYKRRRKGGLDPINHNTTDAHKMWVFYPHRGLNLSKPSCLCVPLFSTSVSIHTLKSSHKLRQMMPTVGLTRSSFVRAMASQSRTKFLPGSRWFSGSLQFITNKFGDLSLQEPELESVL
jgi:hypothetical protein